MFSLSVLVEETVIRLVAELITTFIEGSFVGLTNLVEKVTHLPTHKDGCWTGSEGIRENNERSTFSDMPILKAKVLSESAVYV